MPQAYARATGSWRPVNNLFGHAAGQYQRAKTVWAKASGVWQRAGGTIILNINSNVSNWNMFTAMRAAGYDPTAAAWQVEINIAPGVVVSSTSTASPALQIDALPSGGGVTLNNAGTIVGKGGGGGPARTTAISAAAASGAAGGTALLSRTPVVINNTGTLAGGGGGGGGAGLSYYRYWYTSVTGDRDNCTTGTTVGAAGGAGAGPGAAGGNGGALGSPGGNGPTGSSTGTSECPAVSNPYAAPGAGGGAGRYIDGAGYATWAVPGVRLGAVA